MYGKEFAKKLDLVENRHVDMNDQTFISQTKNGMPQKTSLNNGHYKTLYNRESDSADIDEHIFLYKQSKTVPKNRGVPASRTAMKVDTFEEFGTRSDETIDNSMFKLRRRQESIAPPVNEMPAKYEGIFRKKATSDYISAD
jgi:hypothetical protein